MVGLVVEAAASAGAAPTPGECCSSSPPITFSGPPTGCSTSTPPPRNSLRLGLHTGLTPEPGLGLLRLGLPEVGDPARARRAQADGLRQVARLLHARRLAQPHQRSAPDLVPTWTVRRSSRSSTRTSRETGRSFRSRPHPTLLYNTENGAPGDEREARPRCSKEASTAPIHPGRTSTGGTECGAGRARHRSWRGSRTKHSIAVIRLAIEPNTPSGQMIEQNDE